jgi:hypothetical protein
MKRTLSAGEQQAGGTANLEKINTSKEAIGIVLFDDPCIARRCMASATENNDGISSRR